MHEVLIMQEVIAIALEHAEKESASRIARVALRVGELSGVDPSALEFAFDVVTRGTIAEGAELVIESVAAAPHDQDGGRAGRVFEVAYLEVS